MESNLIVLVLFSVIGVVFAAIGAYIMYRSNKIANEGIRTRAKIIDYESEVDKDMDGYETTYYYPILEFTDKNGNIVKQKTDLASTSKIQTKSIEIFYLVEDGDYNIVMNTTLFRHILPWGFMTIGVFCMLIVFLRFLGVNPLEWINLN